MITGYFKTSSGHFSRVILIKTIMSSPNSQDLDQVCDLIFKPINQPDNLMA